MLQGRGGEVGGEAAGSCGQAYAQWPFLLLPALMLVMRFPGLGAAREPAAD